MKKLILVLAIALIVTPAFGLNVTLTKRTDANIVDINYADACSTNRPRTFALEVSISGGAVFTDINDYVVGESNSISPSKIGYGIYPARITWDMNYISHERDVNSWGSPLAAEGDIGAADDQNLPSGEIVLEFASLYFNRTGDDNSPPLSGRLCSLAYDCNGASNADVCAIEEDQYRGGIVLEDGTAIELNITPLVVCGGGCTKPGKATNVSPTNGATGVATTGTNLTWTAGALATDHIVYFGTASTPPKVGIVAMPTLTYPTGALTINTKYYWHVDANNGCGDPCVGTTWVFDTNCLYVGKVFSTTCNSNPPSVNLTVTQPMVDKWNSAFLNRPKCWCCDGQKCGNAVYTGGSATRVDTADLTPLQGSWNKMWNGAGYKPCNDYNLSGRVDTADLTVLQQHWNKIVGNTGCL